MIQTTARILIWFAMLVVAALSRLPQLQPEQTVHVDLGYRAPGSEPAPNFSPYGTQVRLSDWPADAPLMAGGAARPAKTGTVQIGPGQQGWFKVLATSDPQHPKDFCRLYVDRNRNGNFTDDGPGFMAFPALNEKTKAVWSTWKGAEISILYAEGVMEPYMVNFWAVREAEDAPGIIRYSVSSWRAGKVTVDGVEALVAVMDSDNDAVFNAKDKWSILGASEKDAAQRVVSFTEARAANRFMFVGKEDGKELVLEFRSLTPDGRSLTFAIVDRAIRNSGRPFPTTRWRPSGPVRAPRSPSTGLRWISVKSSCPSEGFPSQIDYRFLGLLVRPVPHAG